MASWQQLTSWDTDENISGDEQLSSGSRRTIPIRARWFTPRAAGSRDQWRARVAPESTWLVAPVTTLSERYRPIPAGRGEMLDTRYGRAPGRPEYRGAIRLLNRRRAI